jgi:uncharacterized membrane protein HdeD (DUF308 family)
MAKKSLKLDKNVTAIAYIIIGILICALRAQLLDWMMTIVGIILIVSGVITILNKNLFEGIIRVVVGAVVIIGGWLFIEILLIVLGVIVIINGVRELPSALKSKDLMPKINAIATILLGVLLVVSKWAMVDIVFIIVGVLAVLSGLSQLFVKK